MEIRTNLRRFKEPRGFIKLIEFLIAILAFSTTAGYYGEFVGKLSCQGENVTTSSELKGKFDYPFKEINLYMDERNCKSGNIPAKHVSNDLPSSLKSSSEFFVFVGVVTFLYCIIAMVYYVCFEDPARYGPTGSGRQMASFATVDFVVTIVLALFWFCGSVAWVVGRTKLEDETSAADFCTEKILCSVDDKANYAGITISVLFGFLCCFLWCANLWFVFKETQWHKEPGAGAAATDEPRAEVPHQEVPGEAVP